MKYFDILKKNIELKKTVKGNSYKIAILSNLTIVEIKEILEFYLRDKKINVQVDIADFDNIVQESIKYSNYDAVIIFWESINFIDGLHSEQLIISNEKLIQIQTKVKNEIELVSKNLKDKSIVIFNKFSSIISHTNSIVESSLNKISKHLNVHLESIKNKNTFLIDIDFIIAKLGLFNSVDYRKFYNSKSIYTNDFYISYVNEILPIFLSVKGKGKKVLVMDCDNTLWRGILGEDGFNGIKMNKDTFPGKIFHEIHQILLSLKNQGVLLAICSKNNFEDVEDVLNNHPDFILSNDDFVIKKVNWNDKVSNLIEISKDLNLGIDSLVFVDDSKFEIGLVNDNLPMIETLLVPENLIHYPKQLYELQSFFYKTSYSKEDNLKTKMYLDEKKRIDNKDSYNSIEGYLESLGLELELFWNDPSKVERAAQLSQKTNQFNLTTKRYTESEILKMTESNKYEVVISSLKDSYGEYGLTGLAIIEYKNNDFITIDSLMLSCRVLGRNIELAFFDELIKKMNTINKIEANFIKTKKNSQVEKFYDKLGFSIKSETENNKEYIIDLKDYNFNKINYIKCI